jgi:TolB protein
VSTACFATAFGFIAGCSESTAVRSGLDPSAGPSLEISDAVHSSGKHGFYFLPPMVAQPSVTGTFDGALSPEVRVCVWDGASCGATISSFTATGGTGGKVIQVDPAGQQYQVNWDTKTCATGACTLDPAQRYRIRVLVGSVELGHADVQIVNNGAGLKNVETSEYIGLVDGRTLPVKFRPEQGIVGTVSISPTVASLTPTKTQAFAASVTDLHGNVVTGNAVAWSTSVPAVATVDGAGLATALAVGSTQITASVDGVQASATLSVTPAGPVGTLVVASTRFGAYGLVIMNADGSGARLLTPFLPNDDAIAPDLSPDRTTVLFAHERQVWKADVATGQVTQLTFFGSYTRYAKWSPNGQKIAFNSLGFNGHNLYLMNPDGSGIQQITNDPNDEHSPTWSPDGQRLAFLSDRTGSQQLFVLDLATGVERQVTFEPTTHNSPRWGPSGSLVAFMMDNAIWVVDVDAGLPPRQVVAGDGVSSEPAFSPDGSQLVFWSTRVTGHPQIWCVNLDGSNLHQFILSSADEISPVWR